MVLQLPFLDLHTLKPDNVLVASCGKQVNLLHFQGLGHFILEIYCAILKDQAILRFLQYIQMFLHQTV